MNYLLTFFLLLYGFISNAQPITKYYDADWFESSQDKAVYYANFVRENKAYATTTFWKANKKPYSRSTYPDTMLTNPMGLQTTYYKSGDIEDSVFFIDGKYSFVYHFEPGHKQTVKYLMPPGATEPVIEGLDEDGKKIKHFTVFKEAEFKGGQAAWEKYLSRKGSKDLDVKGKVPESATAMVRFVIDEDGGVVNVKLYKSSGVKEVDRDAVRLISESPLWKPAIKFNLPVRAYRIQPVTYNTVADTK